MTGPEPQDGTGAATEAEVASWAESFPEPSQIGHQAVPGQVYARQPGPVFHVEAYIDTNGERCGQVAIRLNIWCRVHQKFIPRYGEPWAMSTDEVNRSISEHLKSFPHEEVPS